MDYENHIKAYLPQNEQERVDKENMLDYIRQYRHNVLLRDNVFAHITSSGFILNRSLDKALMIHHNIRDSWSWTGGHADGDDDLLKVALKEAREETGVITIAPLFDSIASLDILTVSGHYRKGVFVSAHLHLSVAYLLVADEGEVLKVKPDENSGVAWFDLDNFNSNMFSAHDIYLYGKLIERAGRSLL